MGRILWSHIEGVYRGQANGGAIITVDDEAMKKALNNAGNAVFDTEWWLETLDAVLERWGFKSKRWTDTVTGMPRLHFKLIAEPAPSSTTNPLNSGAGRTTGPLTTRILNSGKLNSGGLDSGKLRDPDDPKR